MLEGRYFVNAATMNEEVEEGNFIIFQMRMMKLFQKMNDLINILIYRYKLEFRINLNFIAFFIILIYL